MRLEKMRPRGVALGGVERAGSCRPKKERSSGEVAPCRVLLNPSVRAPIHTSLYFQSRHHFAVDCDARHSNASSIGKLRDTFNLIDKYDQMQRFKFQRLSHKLADADSNPRST